VRHRWFLSGQASCSILGGNQCTSVHKRLRKTFQRPIICLDIQLPMVINRFPLPSFTTGAEFALGIQRLDLKDPSLAGVYGAFAA
jgi:hypothetical protein